jgi:drug/metabolite transporter (DMT)-like permease
MSWPDSVRRDAAARGIALVLLSAAAYGAMPILARVAYAEGTKLATLLTWRFVVAVLVFAATSRGTPPLRWRTRLLLWGLGIVFVLNSLCYFLALERVPVPVLALLLYTYPVIVTLLSALAGIDPLTPRNLIAAVLAFAGAALTAGPVAGAQLPGVVLALAAAFIYSVYIVLSSRFARGVSSEAAARHVAQAATVFYVVIATVRGELAPPTSPAAILAILGMGAVCTVLAMRAFLAGVVRIGPARASVLSAFEILVTLVLAALFLGERPGPQALVGGGLIFAGVALQQMRRH